MLFNYGNNEQQKPGYFYTFEYIESILHPLWELHFSNIDLEYQQGQIRIY
jgi:hypothetical protein